MHSCKKIRNIIENYLAGELLPSDREMLDQHLPTCVDCQALMNLHNELTRTQNHVADPQPDAFQAMRSRVMRQIGNQNRAESRPQFSWGMSFFAPALAAVVLLVMGVFLGNWLSQPASVNDQLLLNAVSRQANTETTLADSWDAPLFYSNVAIGDWNNTQVSLGFDVCRSVDLTTTLNSPVAREVLTHAILNSDSIGGRLRAMEIAALSTEQRLTNALMVALQQDLDPTMRIGALGALASKGNNEQVQMALLDTLRNDDSVQVRLLALEHLVNQALGLDALENAIRQGNEKTNSAVFQRARELKTNLSAEQRL